MNLPLILAFLFFIGSLIGWVIELFFRRFFASDNPEHKWINPGFLVGPYLPLYGTGLCFLFIISSINLSFIKNHIIENIVLFILMAIVMTAIEYIAGFIFIKKMRVRLWDYSNECGNIDGLICPKFSFFWAVLGAIYFFFIHPHVLNALSWLSQNLAFSFFIGFFYGVFVIDVSYSMNLMSKLKAFAENEEVVILFQQLQYHMVKAREQLTEKKRFVFSLKSSKQLAEHLEDFIKLKDSVKFRKSKDVKNSVDKL